MGSFASLPSSGSKAILVVVEPATDEFASSPIPCGLHQIPTLVCLLAKFLFSPLNNVLGDCWLNSHTPYNYDINRDD
jgi:hypothetical protein